MSEETHLRVIGRKDVAIAFKWNGVVPNKKEKQKKGVFFMEPILR